jgi:hypothetical protein
MATSYLDDSQIINCFKKYKEEADTARKDRINQNKINFDCYHLKQDWSYKNKGQSREFLPKMAMAVEQAANFIQQGLVDIGEWFRVETLPGVNEDGLRIKTKDIYLILEKQLQKAGFNLRINEASKLGLIGSLMIAKVSGKYVNKPIYRAETELKNGSFKKKLIKKEDKVWQLEISLVRQEDYYPDPTGRGLYEIQDLYMDYYELLALASGKNAIYDLDEVKKLSGSSDSDVDNDSNKARETGLVSINNSGYRKQIKISEIWGNILDEEGNLLHENVVCTIANDQYVIQKPTPNPFWHSESPFVTFSILSVPHSPWGKALMDAPAMLNKAYNEMFNLVLDGGMMSVHGIKQLRKNWLDDESQVEEGIEPGTTLLVNNACPPGGQVLERVDTATVPSDGMNVLNLLNQEHHAASMTNDLRMGVASFRAVKATEVVEANQTMTSMFTGMAKNIEGDEKSGFITPILQKAWKVCAQNMNDFDSNEMKALLGDKKVNLILAMGKEELFAETVQSCRFRTFGISATLNKQKDFTKLTAMLQTVSQNETLTEAFIQKYDFTKLLDEIMKALDINPFKIEADKENGGDLRTKPTLTQEAPDLQSQIKQAGAMSNQGDLSAQAQSQSLLPQTQFPRSRATPRQ